MDLKGKKCNQNWSPAQCYSLVGDIDCQSQIEMINNSVAALMSCFTSLVNTVLLCWKEYTFLNPQTVFLNRYSIDSVSL